MGPQSYPSLRTTLFIFVLGAFHWGINLIWLSLDTRPPLWDMAYHQSCAYDYYQLFGDLSLERLRGAPQLSGVYPPLVHLLIGILYLAFHPGPHIAVLVNLPATFLLLWATSVIAFRQAGEKAARLAPTLLSFYPFMIWMSRETVLDYTLSALVALSIMLLILSNDFESRRHSLLFGLSLGLGMLAKWTFIAYIIFPFALLFLRRSTLGRWERLRNALDAVILGILVSLPWYLPNLPRLRSYFPENMAMGAAEGEPPVLSLQSFIYYLRLLEGYQLFAPFFVLFLFGAARALRSRGNHDLVIFSWLIGGWLTMTLLRTKDPRFTMPLLAAVAVVTAAPLAGKLWRPALAGIMAIGLFQTYLVSFGFARLPAEVVLLRGYRGSLEWNWNLYLQNYHGLIGPPRREHWPLKDMLEQVAADAAARGRAARLGVVPDLPRVNTSTLNLYARLYRLPVRAARLVEARGMDSFSRFDYLLISERDQGPSWTTKHSAEINRFVFDRPHAFRIIGGFHLPDGEYIRLYRIER